MSELETKTGFWKKLEERGFDGHYSDCNGDDSCVCMFDEDLIAESGRLKARDAKLRKALIADWKFYPAKPPNGITRRNKILEALKS